MLNIDNGIDEVIGELDYSYEGFEKITFVVTLDKWDDKEVIHVVINVDDEVFEMGNGIVIMAGDNMFEIQKEVSKYAKEIEKEFFIKSEYEVLLNGGLERWYNEEN